MSKIEYLTSADPALAALTVSLFATWISQSKTFACNLSVTVASRGGAR
jgi:hypothetical protein